MDEVLHRLHTSFASAAGLGASRQPFACGIVLPTGRVLAHRTNAPLLSSVLESAVESLRERHPMASWQDGQVVLSNSPFHGGVSLETVLALAPVVLGGGIAGFVGLAVRYRDIGAMAAGAFTLRRETRHEGFCLRLLKIAVANGQLPETLLAMLRANVRYPDEATRWLGAQVAAVQGAAQTLASTGRLDGVSVEGMGVFEKVGFGRFSGHVGSIRSDVTVTPADMKIALAVSDPDSIGAEAYAPLAATRAGVLTAVSEVVDVPAWMVTSRVRIAVDETGILHALYPAAVSRGATTAYSCYEAVHATLVQATGNGDVRPRQSFDSFSGLES